MSATDFERREFVGGAAPTALAGGINATATTILGVDLTNWPTGGTGPFYVVIGRGTATEEKVRCTARSTNSLTVADAGDRGADGTNAQTHVSGEDLEHCLTALDADEANRHYSDPLLDHHTQYLNSARHDIAARHTFGAAYGTPVAPSNVGTSAAAGSGDNPAREDHVHILGSGSISAAGMFAAGVVDAAAIATDAVGSAEIAALAVGTAELAADSVTAAKIANDAVGNTEIAALAVASGELAADAVISGKIADDAIDDQALFSDPIRPIMVGTAAAKPATSGAGRVVGQHYYETDAGSLRTVVWNGTAWVNPDKTIIGNLNMAAHTMTAFATPQTLDTATITVPTGRAYGVQAVYAGQINVASSNDSFAVTVVSISFDGGSTWDVEPSFTPGNTFIRNPLYSLFMGNTFASNGTATGTIKIRVEGYQSAGFAFGTFDSGHLTWVVAPS